MYWGFPVAPASAHSWRSFLVSAWAGSTAWRSPERSALDRELGERIDAAVRRLPPKFREVWLLAALQEVPYPEVAQILDIPVGTVKSRMFQASRLLRSELEPYVS